LKNLRPGGAPETYCDYEIATATKYYPVMRGNITVILLVILLVLTRKELIHRSVSIFLVSTKLAPS